MHWSDARGSIRENAHNRIHIKTLPGRRRGHRGRRGGGGVGQHRGHTRRRRGLSEAIRMQVEGRGGGPGARGGGAGGGPRQAGRGSRGGGARLAGRTPKSTGAAGAGGAAGAEETRFPCGFRMSAGLSLMRIGERRKADLLSSENWLRLCTASRHLASTRCTQFLSDRAACVSSPG